MNARTKLVAFAAGLALVFGGAALAGSAVHPLHKPPTTHAHMGMNEGRVR